MEECVERRVRLPLEDPTFYDLPKHFWRRFTRFSARRWLGMPMGGRKSSNSLRLTTHRPSPPTGGNFSGFLHTGWGHFKLNWCQILRTLSCVVNSNLRGQRGAEPVIGKYHGNSDTAKATTFYTGSYASPIHLGTIPLRDRCHVGGLLGTACGADTACLTYT